MVKYGMRKDEVIKRLKLEIDKDPDLKYYLNNEYVESIIDLLIEGIGKVIEENNEKLEKDINESLGKKSNFYY